MVILKTDLGFCFIKGELGKKVMKQSLSWWGDVTTDNVKETIERNKRVKSERLIKFRIVKDILDNAGIEYWIDYGTLLGAYRSGRILLHDNDIDFSCRKEYFEEIDKLLKKNLPSRYQYEKISNLFGNSTTKYQIFLKDGEKLYDNKNNEWYLVQHDIYFYDYDKIKKMYVMDYQGFGINEKWFPEDVIFPLGCIQFEGLMCPCPNKVQDYLEICYGYIGEDFIFDSETNLFIKKEI